MIVIALLSGLVIAGKPTYERYKIRTNISDGVSILNEYKKSLVILWKTDSKLPSEDTMLPGGPIDLPFNKTISGEPYKNIESLMLFKVSDGVVIKLAFANSLFPDTPVNNRSISLGAKANGTKLEFVCGNFSTDVQSSADIGFLDLKMLPHECQHNGVSSWITNHTV